MGRRERPLDPEDGAVQRFAFELRRLRESAGTPSYRELAKRAHYSVTALSEAAGGEAFPSLPVTLAYVRACGGDPNTWRQQWEQVSHELATDEVDSEKAPYLGLASFQPEDADRYFGRGDLVEELCARLDESPFLAVFGASGSGKSSLLRAGLLPAIWRGHLPGSGDWPTILLTPGNHPVEQLAIRLANLCGASAVAVLADLTSDPDGVRVLVRQVLAGRPARARLVIVADQFEEIFTLCRDEAERNGFLACLLAAGDRARIVVGVRADFYARCAQYPALVAALRDRQVLVGPMDADDLRAVVREPAARAGLAVETALVEAVLADAAGEPGALPLISHALVETWKQRSGDRLTLAGYRRAGGVRGALARTADRVLDELDTREQHVVRDVFLRLTALGEGTEDTRRRVARSELLGGPDTESVTAVLDRLTEERLVTLGQHTVEVAHEALIRSWPRLRAWLTEDREALSAHRRLTENVAEWERHGRDDGLLYRGARLAAWQERPQDRLNDAEREFLAVSRRAEDRERLARRRRVRLVLGGLGTATAVVTVLAVLALVLARQAGVEREIAYSRQLVADARAQSQLDPELGLLLAREAFRVRPSADTEAALRQAAIESHVRATISGHGGKMVGVAFAPDGRQLATGGEDGALRVWEWRDGRPSGKAPIVLRGHRGEVRSLVFSRDGTRIAAAGPDGVWVWDWARGEAVTLRGHDGEVWGVAFGPDGRVASAGQDGTVRLWNADGSGEPVVWHGHDGRVLGVAFSPDGSRLATSGGDGTVRIWDPAGNAIVLTGHKNSVEAVAFSPDGRHVATASTDGTARVWDVTGETDPVVLGSHDGTAEGIAYSADGRWVASTGNDGAVRVWNAESHATPTVLRGHRGTVWAAGFSPDGRTVASASDDGTVRVWDLDVVGALAVLRGHEGPVWRAEFSADGRRVASASEDGTVRVWSVAGRADPVVLRGAGSPVRQVVFSRDGRRVAGVDADGTVWIWRADGAGEPVTLPGDAWQVAFSPDGRRVAVASRTEAVHLWPTTGTGEPTVLPGSQGKLAFVAWSPDGRRVAAAGHSGVIVVWTIGERGAPLTLRGHRGLVWTVVFSQDGTRLASGGNDGTVRVWPVTGRTEPVVLRGHQGVVWSVVFTVDGRHLVTSGNDATVRRWTLGRPGESLVFRGFRASVESVAVSATPGRFATAHDDGTVRLWHCPVCGPAGDVLSYAEKHLTRELTGEERRTYLAGGDP
jgi:WD40 repeat protein